MVARAMSAVRSPGQAPAKGPLALIALAVLSGGLVLGLVIAGLTHSPAPAAHAEQLPSGLEGKAAPQFRLRDGRGGVIDTHALQGRPYAVTFLYTRCPDVCPAIAEDLRAA